MHKTIGTKPIAVTIAIGTLILIAALIVTTSSNVHPSEAGFDFLQGFLDTDKQTIQYTSNLDNGMPYIVVGMRDPKTPDDLRYYAQISRTRGEALLQAHVNSLYVWVTFRHTISIQEFKDFVGQYGLNAKRYTIRAYGEKGDRITIEGGPQGGDIVPAMYDRVVESVQARENGNALIGGVFQVQALIEPNAYQKLLDDARVFMADVTATLAYQELVSRKLTTMAWTEYANRVQLGITNEPFGNMEKLGLDKFATQ